MLFKNVLHAARVAALAAEKPLYAVTGGRLAKGRFLSAVPTEKIGTDVKIVAESDDSVTLAKFGPDGKIYDGDFKILTATDLHLYDDPAVIDLTLQKFADRVRETKPDLILITGDSVVSRWQQLDAVQFAAFMDGFGVYWAYCFGNHEAREEKGPFKERLFDSLCRGRYSLCRYGKPELFGVGNYAIDILAGENTLRETLVLLDSGRDILDERRRKDGVPDGVDGYDYIKPEQTAWYLSHLAACRKKYGAANNMLYFHIPVPEFAEVWEQGEDGRYTPTGKADLLYGWQNESVGASPFNSGLYDAAAANGCDAIFCGHDHMNGWAAKLRGVTLVYTQAGDYSGCYAPDNFRKLGIPEKDWYLGATLTTLHPDGGFTVAPVIG